jgi:transcription elongation factor Elf1
MRCPNCGKKLAEEMTIKAGSRVVIICTRCHERIEVVDKSMDATTQ